MKEKSYFGPFECSKFLDVMNVTWNKNSNSSDQMTLIKSEKLRIVSLLKSTVFFNRCQIANDSQV